MPESHLAQKNQQSIFNDKIKQNKRKFLKMKLGTQDLQEVDEPKTIYSKTLNTNDLNPFLTYVNNLNETRSQKSNDSQEPEQTS